MAVYERGKQRQLVCREVEGAEEWRGVRNWKH